MFDKQHVSQFSRILCAQNQRLQARQSWVKFAFAGLLLAVLPAQAGINQLVAGMLASGSTPFSIDDTSASDNNIRTFDYATYRFGFSITPTDPQALMKLSVGSFILPGSYVGPVLNQVAFFDAKDLPTGAGGCQNVRLSALSAADIAGGNTSGVTLGGQTLYCVQPSNVGGNNLNFRLQVAGNAPNGTTINPPVFEFSSTSNTATTSLTSVLVGAVGSEVFYGLSSLTVRASPKWNLDKSAIRAALYVPGSGPPGSGPGGIGGANGFVFGWNIGVYAKGSRKGLEALSTAGFTENWADPDFPNAKLVTWNMNEPGFVSTNNIVPNNCGNWQNAQGVLGNVFDNIYYLPYDLGDFAYTAFDYTVANGGTCRSTLVNQAARTANFELVNTDWSLKYYPVRKGANSAAQIIVNPINLDDSTNEWWAASKSILIWVPETDIPIPPNPNTQFLTNTANFFGTSVSGQPNIEPLMTDNVNTQGATRQTAGNLYKTHRPWFFLNNPFGLELAERDPAITGDSQTNQIAPNQLVLSSPQAFNGGTTAFGPGQMCDKIDNSRFALFNTTDPAYVGAYPNTTKDAATGIALWRLSGSASTGPTFTFELGVSNSGTTANGWNSFNSTNNEYANPATSGSTQSDAGCGDADAIWYPSVAAVLAARGALGLQDINIVRGKYVSWPGSASVIWGIPLKSLSTYAHGGTDIGIGGTSFVAGSSTVGAFSSNQARWDTGVAGVFGDPAGSARVSDSIRFFQTEYVQISKSSPTNPNNTLVNPGTQITYALRVNLTTSGSAHTTTVNLWDVLPANLDYVAGSSTFGGAPLADPVCSTTGLPTVLFPATSGPPASAAGSTPTGFKACKWVLPNQNVAKASPGAAAGNIPELRFRAAVSVSAPNSPPVLLNTAFADTALNLFPDPVYGGAQIGFACVGGQNCFFSNWALSVAGTDGIALSKSVGSTLFAPNRTTTYTIGYAAVGSNLASPRIVDVLPYVGDGRSVASSYSGTFRLTGPVSLPVASAGPPATAADSSATILYTNNLPANINRDPYGPNSLDTHHILNGTGVNSAATTIWCAQAQFNTGSCPISFANATGILILPLASAPSACGIFGTVPCLPPGSLYQAILSLQASGNAVGNIYSNDFRADSPSLSARAPGSNLVTTRVVAPDLILDKTVSPSVVNSGSTVVYTLTPKNSSGANVGIVEASPLPAINVIDNLPGNVSIAGAASVDGGAAWNCAASTAPSTVSCLYIGALPIPAGAVVGNAINVTVIATSTSSGSVTVVNTSTISMTGQSEISGSNNTGTATLQIRPTFSDVVSIVSLPPSATTGSIVTGTVVFANIASGPGAITATSAVGTVTLSNGQILTYTLGDLGPGQSTSQTFTTTVPDLTTTLVANSDITSTTADLNPSNNTSTAALSVIRAANLGVSKDNGVSSLAAGSITAYTLTFTNGGPSNAAGALIADRSAAGLVCTTVTCISVSGGAACPTSLLPLGTPKPAASTSLFSSGETIPNFPAASEVSLRVVCGVVATGL